MGMQRRARLGIARIAGLLGAAALGAQAWGQPTYVFSDLPCATFVDLPPAAGSAVPMLPLVTALCDASGLTVTSRNYPLPPAPNTDDPYYTGTFQFSATSSLNDPIDPAINPGDRRGASQSSGGATADLLLDFSVPLSSVGMSTFQVNGSPLTSPDRIRVFDGPLGTGNLLASIQSQPPPTGQFRRAVRFTGFNAGTAVIRSIVIDVDSDPDGLFLDGLAFGLAGPSGPVCDSIDFNNDGLFPDTADIDDMLSVFSGGACTNDPNCHDIDFNNDGLFPDTLDIDSLLSVFSGGPCL